MLKKKGEFILIKILFIVVVILLIIGTGIFFAKSFLSKSQPILCLTEEQIDELDCLSRHYKFKDVVIYDYPENPYVVWNGNKAYLRKEGLCE